MKRFKTTLLIAALLSIFSISVTGQYVATSPLSYYMPITLAVDPITHIPVATECTWLVNINDAKAVRFTYTTDMVYGAHQLYFYELGADGTTYQLVDIIGAYNGSQPMNFATGYSSGTFSTKVKNGKAMVKLICNSVGIAKFNVQFGADNSLAINGDVNAAGDLNAAGNVKLGPAGGGISTISGMANSGAIQIKSNPTASGSANRYLRLGWRDNNALFSPALSINEDLRVGIGTTTPATPLDVYGNATFGTTYKIKLMDFPGHASWIDMPVVVGKASGIGSGGVGVNPWIGYAGAATQWFTNSLAGDICYRNTGGKLLFGNTTASAAMSVSGNKVGIGTTTPDSLLTVKGTIHTRGVLIDMSGALVPDFVFDANYNLKPLNEVEQYIKVNKHLAEIPSASEVSQKGINVGDMQNKLLQKIEELTLYMIEQQKTINQQSAKIEELEKKIK